MSFLLLLKFVLLISVIKYQRVQHETTEILRKRNNVFSSPYTQGKVKTKGQVGGWCWAVMQWVEQRPQIPVQITFKDPHKRPGLNLQGFPLQ